ncbi:hypothetical protein D7322_08795 [Sphingobacterium puteale]|uniref:Uncharacterized protein n=1 Tax=Sphingobacterium puteale TaxID=2420510 RepID=A0A420W0T3_9SPHI|nr:hypothetical protein D7322_08795 [Sphingobacterium puteale]
MRHWWAIKNQEQKITPGPLIEILKNESFNTSICATALKTISLFSKQPFDRQLPKDPGHWKVADLRIDLNPTAERDAYFVVF